MPARAPHRASETASLTTSPVCWRTWCAWRHTSVARRRPGIFHAGANPIRVSQRDKLGRAAKHRLHATEDPPMVTKPFDYRHAGKRAMRVRVYRRDHFTCQRCGWHPSSVPVDYDGRFTVDRLMMDHVVPRCRGGASVDSNMQTLCEPCNCKKGGR